MCLGGKVPRWTGSIWPWLHNNLTLPRANPMWHEENKEQLSPENLHKQTAFSFAISVLISMGARLRRVGGSRGQSPGRSCWELEVSAELQMHRRNSAARPTMPEGGSWRAARCLQHHRGKAEIVQPGEAGQRSHRHNWHLAHLQKTHLQKLLALNKGLN